MSPVVPLNAPDIQAIHTIAGTYSHHGGPSRSVPALCDALSENAEVTLLTAAPEALRSTLCLPTKAKSLVVREPETFGRLRGVAQFERALRGCSKSIENGLIHDHGIWLPSNHVAARVAKRYALPRVVSPRGMLSNWSMNHHGLHKKLAWHVYQRQDLFAAAAFHATSEKEAQEIRDLGFTQPIAVIENGVNAVSRSVPNSHRLSDSPIALFLSRMHPKKGVLDLIRAWARVAPAHWQMWLAGPSDESYQRILEAETQRLNLSDRVRFIGEVADADKWELYRQASLFVLPSYDENFGIVIAEALSAQLPVITTTATPWEAIDQQGLGWVVAPGERAIADALAGAFALSAKELEEMGARGQAWANTALGWPRIAGRMMGFYRWLLNPTSQLQPEWVQG